MTRVAVLLRGVNVGKAKRISSAELRAVVEAVGLTDVSTLLNSGNAVGTSSLKPASLATAVSTEIERRCGFTCDVVVRTEAEVNRALERDLLRDVAIEPSRHLLVFLGSKPAAAAVHDLEAIDVTPDVFALDDTDLHTWMPTGVSESRLQQALTKGVLGVTWTGRNWSTLQRIADAM
jgi:hypothetical protein